MKELFLNEENPCPFVQPFLVLGFREKDSKSSILWNIEVNGQISKYLVGGDPKEGPDFNLLAFATELLNEIIRQLEKNGLHVIYVSTYTGSAGPNIILRDDALFRRVNLDKILVNETQEHY